ncbi:DUF3991 and toprim domain-containing protein [Ruminococcus sp.]|uniref:DUF3991 and toprim domain-containing protein n=1 Tax=Ruminococcus sp. TaxID=41978 RepID=UPI003AEF7B0A
MRGEKLERVGREHKLIYYDGSGKHDSITMSGSRWFDHKNQVGGGAIKFMQEFYDMDFQTAVQELLGQTVTSLSHAPPKAVVHEEKTKEFKLPKSNENMHRVFAYLIKQRFINPEIISFFARNHTLYEDKEHHNAVFVGLDENGVPRQASKRSTNSFGKTFRITCEGSDTRYSFSHFGKLEKLFVFEAPIDMLSYLTLHPENWQQHSYIAMNGVYENAVLTALKNHSNINEIVLCVDNDEGGIEAVDRLRDILRENGYENVRRFAPKFKDWNEDLKAKNGAKFLPAVPHKRKEEYHRQAENLQYLKCRPDKLTSQIYAAFKNEQYKYFAEYALAGSAFFIDKSCEKDMFAKLRAKLKAEYKPYTDKGKITAKQRNLQECVTAVMKDLRQTARTREQCINTAKLLYQLADSAVRLSVEKTLSEPVAEHIESEDIVSEPEPFMEFG